MNDDRRAGAPETTATASDSDSTSAAMPSVAADVHNENNGNNNDGTAGARMRFLILDNYDSFVYNLAQYLGELGVACDVIRNDRITIDQIRQAGYDAIVISPGPGTPEDARYFGVCMDVIRQMGPDRMPILGVCLGHQGIIHAFGGRVVNAGQTRHGKTSPIRHVDGSKLFEGVRNPFRATRYHSLVGDKTVIPDILRVTATAGDDGEVMAVEHRDHLIQGVQFHPESIMTEEGRHILANFVGQVAGGKGGDQTGGNDTGSVAAGPGRHGL